MLVGISNHGSGWVTVGRAFTFDSRNRWFESNREYFYAILNPGNGLDHITNASSRNQRSYQFEFDDEALGKLYQIPTHYIPDS